MTSQNRISPIPTPIWYGGDYNPEQWPEDVWDEDVRLMEQAGVNMATVGVFSWARIEPQRGKYDFEWLDAVLAKLHAGGVRVDLATATASPPPWLTVAHPEILPVTETGTVMAVGSRQAYCPSSPIYRAAAARLVEALASRYGDHPALELWHVNNEFGCHVARCYCETSARAFRRWLEVKYHDINRLNDSWGTSFWSQRYASFDEVGTPRAAPYFRNPAQLLDFDRFSSAELLACYKAEVEILRRFSPMVPVTTNFMGFFKDVDYWAWADAVDVISDDSYPDPADPLSSEWAAMSRDLMRSLGGGKPWILMEQSTGAVNWRRTNAFKVGGQMSAWSHQAVARGADGILFFQWRQSAVGGEKFHSGMLPHAGVWTRRWREVVKLGDELRTISEATNVVGTSSRGEVAIVLDWDSWWALEQSGLPATLDYMHEVFAWHRQFTSRGILVDFIRPTDDPNPYAIVVVPTLFAASNETLASFAQYESHGGTLVVTYQSAITDENLRIRLGGYLGPLQKTLGLRVEEFAPPAPPDLRNTAASPPESIPVEGPLFGRQVSGGVWAEVIEVTDATIMANFGGKLHGNPAVTCRRDAGTSWYVATSFEGTALATLTRAILAESKLASYATITPHPSLEIVQRGDACFMINHGDAPVAIEKIGVDVLSRAEGPVVLDPHQTIIFSPSEKSASSPGIITAPPIAP